jgi:hypothetical protein
MMARDLVQLPPQQWDEQIQGARIAGSPGV